MFKKLGKEAFGLFLTMMLGDPEEPDDALYNTPVPDPTPEENTGEYPFPIDDFED